MLSKLKHYGVVCFLACTATPSSGEGVMSKNLLTSDQGSWSFVTDGVMGGVSTGEASFMDADGTQVARMTGSVSTENNGGFIQMRLRLSDAPAGAAGVRLVARGNAERYFVHLRTTGTLLPWQYYQAGFETSGDWTEIRIGLEAFKPSGALLRSVPKADSVNSIGLVAFGRDHEAELEVKEVGFY